MRRLNPHRWLLLLLLTTSGLSACSVLPRPAPQDIYRLPPSDVTESMGEPVDRALRIARPSADGLLRSTRIVVLPEGNRLSVYAAARWNSPTPILWRENLLGAFRNDGRIARLSRAEERLQANIELGGALRDFQVEYRDGLPEVIIQFDAYLVDITSRRIIASQLFAATERVDGGKVPAVVAAFGRASDTLAADLIEWTLQHIK